MHRYFEYGLKWSDSGKAWLQVAERHQDGDTLPTVIRCPTWGPLSVGFRTRDDQLTASDDNNGSFQRAF